MNKEEHLLTCLSEECGEIIQSVSKALRFGLDDSYPEKAITNRQEIFTEFVDLMGVMEYLIREGVIIPSENVGEQIENKIAKINKWMEHGRKNGTLV